MIWKRLSREFLQKTIGEDLLERLEIIIPSLHSESISPNDIYRKKTLTKIFSAFAGSQIFKDKNFKRLFLYSLSPEELDHICKATGVGLDTDDFEQRVTRHIGQGWMDQEYCANFLKALNLPDIYLPVGKEAFVYEENLVPPKSPYKPLIDYQFQVYMDCIRELEIARSRFIVQMPTGSGKTRTSMQFISEYLKKSPKGSTVLWLAHSEELCEQAIECFKEVWGHVGTSEVKLFRCWGSNSSLPYLFNESAFIVGGFQKLYSLLRKSEVPFVELSKRIHLLVVDEAHKVLAPTYEMVTKALIGNKTKVIGLTATPGRSADDFVSNKKLAEFFFSKIFVIRTEGAQSVIHYLRNKAILSKASFHPLQTNLTYELSKKERRYLEQQFDFPPGFLNNLARDDIRNLEIIKSLDKECEKEKSVLFFACSVEHSKFICSLLIYLGYAAVHIDGTTDKIARRQYLKDFKEGKIQVVSNYGVLSTGFDAPKTDVVFISRPTKSLVLYSQMIGRGLRGPAIGGTEYCTIIDVKDNIIGLPDEEDIYDYFQDYYE